MEILGYPVDWPLILIPGLFALEVWLLAKAMSKKKK
jgi:hypothetical protein